MVSLRLRKIIPYFILTCLCLCGCTILSKTDDLAVLGDYSREKDNQHRLVKSINDHYDVLTKVIARGTISNYKNEPSFVYSFGDPILKKDLNGGGQRWLYRYAIFSLAKDKVYVYFDRTGKLVKWEKIPCSSFF